MMHRSLLIDAMKSVAAALVVVHHLVFYGPMADHLRPIMPALWGWMANDARMAVQVFLVVAGYFAARALAPLGRLRADPILPVLWNRFLRLALPYHVVLILAIVSNELARSLMTHPSISAPASIGQLIAHALLLHDLLGYEALSAGIWFVAIDMQLFLSLAGLLWLGRLADDRARRWNPRRRHNCSFVLVALTALLSIYYFNLDYAWDAWVLYFFGAYALGASAWWASRYRWQSAWLAGITGASAGALLLAYRQSLLLALVVALLLSLQARRSRQAEGAGGPFNEARSDAAASPASAPFLLAGAIHWSGRLSYSVFLVHFPICLVVNAVFTRFLPTTAAWQGAGVGLALAASIAGGAIFHRLVEAPLLRRIGQSRGNSLGVRTSRTP